MVSSRAAVARAPPSMSQLAISPAPTNTTPSSADCEDGGDAVCADGSVAQTSTGSTLRMMRSMRAIRSLPAKDVSFAARIGAAAQGRAARIDADRDDSGAHAVRTEDVQFVSTRRQRVAHFRRRAIFNLERARLAAVPVQRAVWVQ